MVLGLLWAGLSFARSLGRAGVPVTGITMHPHEFGARSRYLRDVSRGQGDGAGLKALRAAARGGDKPVLLPERDDHVELVLRHWDEVRELFELPMPDVRSRLQAVEMLLSQGIGRAPTAPEATTRSLPQTAAEVEKMSWAEMQ